MSSSANFDSEITKLKEKIDKIFNSVEHLESLEEAEWSPAVDILEDKDNIIVKADIPGVTADTINLTIAGDTLHINGERKQESGRIDENYHLIGRKYGKFDRAILLPVMVDSDNIKASYRDGVLTVILPKLEKSKADEIKIQVG